MTQLDERLLRVSIEVNGKLNVYENLSIKAQGRKTGGFEQNECNITIANLDKPTRDFLLTEGSPFNRESLERRPKIIVEAGRKSYGYFVLYEGDISTVEVSQPPDITIKIKALTQQFNKGNLIARSDNAITQFSAIAGKVAEDLGVALDFQATDKNIANYTFTGAAEKQVEKLYQYGDVDAFVDDNTLVVKDRNKPLPRTIRVLNIDTGLIGIPQFVDYGVQVKFFVDNVTKIGGLLRVESDIYPASTGDYVIYSLEFDIANRDTPFYFMAKARRINQ